jgi:hypothetical protein
LDDESTSESTIVVGNERIAVHKFFLILHSPVFKAMFESGMKESTSNELMITDFPCEVVNTFLICVYDPSVFEVEKPKDVYAMVAKYAVDPICKMCEKQIAESLNQRNIRTVFAGHLQMDFGQQNHRSSNNRSNGRTTER